MIEKGKVRNWVRRHGLGSRHHGSSVSFEGKKKSGDVIGVNGALLVSQNPDPDDGTRMIQRGRGLFEHARDIMSFVRGGRVLGRVGPVDMHRDVRLFATPTGGRRNGKKGVMSELGTRSAESTQFPR